ncbi:MAG TPA: hypothetical protein VN932_03210 [Rhizomicrobium sp.]|nr:hypothetical protein [Rhizomicrobium sp.]
MHVLSATLFKYLPTISVDAVADHVVGEIFCALLALLLTALAVLYAFGRNFSARLAFFGIDRRAPTASIFVSNILVRPRGTQALEKLSQGYSGPALSKIEYEAALEIQKLLTARPVVILPEPLQDALRRLRQREVNVAIRLSPATGIFLSADAEQPPAPPLSGYLTDTCNIIIGSQVYNSLAKWYLEQYLPDPQNHFDRWFAIAKNDQNERIVHYVDRAENSSDELLRGALEAPGDGVDRLTEPAFIMRFREAGKTIFLCAGIPGWSTGTCVAYLAKNWKALHKTFGCCDFGIAIRCQLPTNKDNFADARIPANHVEHWLKDDERKKHRRR